MSQRSGSSSSPSTTFLLCAESGYFEAQTLLAIECLRAFGGRLATAPVIVVTPRFGPSLASETLNRFEALGVSYLYSKCKTNCSWYAYMNKASAAAIADDLVKTDQIIWLDSDVLVVAEPQQLILRPGEEFTCCSLDKNVGSSGPSDPNEKYWEALSSHYKIPLERLPMVETSLDREVVRFRLHSGVYSYRKETRLGQAFAHDLESMLNSGIAYSRELPFPGDDVALAYSVVRLNLRWRQLPLSCNVEMTPSSLWYRREQLREAQIIHYHKALATSEGCEWFIQELRSRRPEVADWLKHRLPIPVKTGGFGRSIVRRALYERRKFGQRQAEKRCQFYV